MLWEHHMDKHEEYLVYKHTHTPTMRKQKSFWLTSEFGNSCDRSQVIVVCSREQDLDLSHHQMTRED